MTSCDQLLEETVTRLRVKSKATTRNNLCVLSMPLSTAHGRRVAVYAEPIGDDVLVHDGAVTCSELYLQGLHLTTSRTQRLRAIAKAFGAEFRESRFVIKCSTAAMGAAALAVVQCATAATVEILHHPFVPRDRHQTATRVGKALEEWSHRPLWVAHVARRVRVRGSQSLFEHEFDAVAYRASSEFHNVAVKVVPSSHTPEIQARQYALMALDLKQSADVAGWKQLAVVARGERWADDQLEAVSDLADKLLVFTKKDEAGIERAVQKAVASLGTEAA